MSSISVRRADRGQSGRKSEKVMVICNKSGIGNCLKCEHGRPHEPVRLNPRTKDLSTCQKLDDCGLHIDGKYTETRVKCK